VQPILRARALPLDRMNGRTISVIGTRDAYVTCHVRMLRHFCFGRRGPSR